MAKTIQTLNDRKYDHRLKANKLKRKPYIHKAILKHGFENYE